MKELTKVSKSELDKFVKKMNKARVDAGGTALTDDDVKRLLNRQTGNNGRAVGAEYTLNGKVDFAHPIKDSNDKVVGTYEAVGTEEGDWISLTQLMGISSLNGYTLEGKVPNVFREKVSKNSPVIADDVRCEVEGGNDFDFGQVWTPPTRNKLMFLAMIDATPDFFKGVKARFLGVAAKENYAKKDAAANYSVKYCAGDARAIVSKLWHLEF